MDILTNPYVIIFIVLAVIISNIMALKYTAHSRFGMKKKNKTEQLSTTTQSSIKSSVTKKSAHTQDQHNEKEDQKNN